MIKRLLFLCLLLTTACTAPHVQPYAVAMQAPHLTQDAQQFVAADNTILPVRHWLPQKRPKAVIVALHGFNDYSNAFAIPAPAFNKEGIAVYAFDQRGFGRSANIGIWAGEDNLVRDAGDFIHAIKKQYPHVPLYVLGESMGGAVAIATLAHSDASAIDGVILVAPAVWGGDSIHSLMRLPLWMLVHTWPDKAFTGEHLHIRASDNITVLRALAADPLFIKSTRADALYGLVHLMDSAYSQIDQLQVPVLLLYGAHDQVIPPDAVKNCARRLKKQDTVAYYAGGYHMLLRDIHNDVPIQDIASWIMHNDQTLPSGNDENAKRWLR